MTETATRGPMEWLRRHQQIFHDQFHAYEGSQESCTEGYCSEINPLITTIREQGAIRAEMLALVTRADELHRRLAALIPMTGNVGTTAALVAAGQWEDDARAAIARAKAGA